MHIVIADDLTGAAEIAGVGLSRGLKGVVSTTVDPGAGADLWCLATDTRSFARKEAGEKIEASTRELHKLHPDIFYKKIDSALRGNVMLECDVFTKTQGLDRAIIIPANPSLNRIVKDGTYYINDVPLADTNFFRSKKGSSRLLDLINPDFRDRTRVIREISDIDGPGFYIGEVTNHEDLLKWAALADQDVALCGGSDFFDALLEYRGLHLAGNPEEKVPFGERQLLILGSATVDNEFLIKQISDQGFSVSNMPWEIFNNAKFSASDIEQWYEEIKVIYENSKKLVITMSYKDLPFEERPHLKVALGDLIIAMMKHSSVDELFVEGGATSYAILNKMEADELYPVQHLARGVTRMELAKYKPLKMTLKPGSYKWPDSIWPRLKISF
ncbi:four-carbon acid sugar kinase family protein [Flavilitoribacter nigricans]|uniref:Four-carbon acid sugar kinase N-terminal domain-containing protein n=1 Tax=Flavilitoribacter nigricans (strain ATCC 23147 / DSM 23189 / NBRC 102662 / NCIMB 1420 / SS-2) TaxID=1122177 RepID=A0A2D0N231_FLAN2|nr:four-carbon acid sugar kinase family protein [Flavilitoribacter nigricans]PHN02448.1 hypothetical protein CRP01_32215 [Flavilitoribacter nigricans DSM 23189 = NBRC 102662]